MADASSILSRLLAALSISDPTWDTSVGSATYKIFESVANELAYTANNSVLQTYSYDVNSKFGTELDAFVNLFGINRQYGKRSTGTVVFSSNAPAVQDYYIPLGTQVYVLGTQGASNIYFNTTAAAVLSTGETTIEVPIISVLPGSINNINADTITRVATSLVGITSVTNLNPLTGGSDSETDAQLKARFQATAFSNFSGTNEKYLSVILQNPNVSQVNIIGAQEFYSEQLQVQTVLSGLGTQQFNLGLQNLTNLIAFSGSTLASGYQGPLQANQTIPSTAITASPAGILTAGTTIFWDGTNYNLSSPVTNSGTLIINYVASGVNPQVVLSGNSTYNDVRTVLSGILSSQLKYGTTVNVTVTGTNSVVASGAYVTFSQNIPYTVAVISGGGAGAVSNTNVITSQIPDSKYSYPQGGEQVGYSIGGPNQTLLQNNVDYVYPSSPTVPLQITLNPLASNAPYTYTGANLQLVSQYVPSGSRISNPTTNSNFIDIYTNGTTTTLISEQVIALQGNTFGTNANFPLANFLTASGGQPASGDIYIPINSTPMGNFPAQVVSGNAPTYIQFGNYPFPISLQEPTSISRATVSGAISTNILYTNTSVSGWNAGVVLISGSAIPVGTYVTYVIPGSPNQLVLNNNLTANITNVTVSGAVVAYPVYDNTNTRGSRLDIGGVALRATDKISYPSGIYPSTVNASTGTISFSYYSDIVEIDDLVQQSRIIGTNVLVHQADYLNIVVNLSVVYDGSLNISAVNSDLQTRLSTYFNNVQFDVPLRFNDIVRVLLNTPGVTNLRITTATDNPTNYGLAIVNVDGSVKSRATSDIRLTNTQLPVLRGVNFMVFGENNF